MSVTIEIYGPYSTLKGDFPLEEIKLVTSWAVDGARYSPAFKKGLWDGRKHLFKPKTGAFPTGLMTVVKKCLDDSKTDYDIVDHRSPPEVDGNTFDIKGISFAYPYDYQLETAKKMVEAKRGIIKIATNGGKGIIAASVINYLNLRTLFIVPNRELLYQSEKVFKDRLDVVDGEIGLIGDGHWNPGSWITVATVDTLESRLEKEECVSFLHSIDLVFYDEVHRAGSETGFAVSTMCPAYYAFGMSGTPNDRTDGANLAVIGAFGDILVSIGNKFLVDRKISAKGNIIFDKVTSPPIPKKTPYATAYKQGVTDNETLNQKVVDWVVACRKNDLSVLVLIEEIGHGKALDQLLWTHTGDTFIPHQFVFGDESTETRQQAIKVFGDRTLPVLIASTIFDEGINLPTIDVLICAGSRKSKIRTMQRLGRGLRGDKLILIEFSNFCHSFLLEHSLKRYNDYKEEQCFDMYRSTPDAALIKELWSKPR
jgi:superfamily II DNA or RNA helicase